MLELASNLDAPSGGRIRIAADSNKVVIMLVLTVVLGIQLQVSGQDILQKPYPGKGKACKSLGMPAGLRMVTS